MGGFTSINRYCWAPGAAASKGKAIEGPMAWGLRSALNPPSLGQLGLLANHLLQRPLLL